MYLCTEGEMWSDRVELFSDLLQRSRLGGMALRRNQIYPGHLVSWRFDGPPTNAENVGILIEGASSTGFRVTGYNLTNKPIKATLTGQNIANGLWSILLGGQLADGTFNRALATRVTMDGFGRDVGVPVVFPPHQT